MTDLRNQRNVTEESPLLHTFLCYLAYFLEVGDKIGIIVIVIKQSVNKLNLQFGLGCVPQEMLSQSPIYKGKLTKRSY